MGEHLNIEQIMKRLPHRYPFLMIDRVLDVEYGQHGIGLKNITINEPFFQGHFPKSPIVPGVLLIEMMAQMAALVYVKPQKENETEDLADQVGYIAKVESVKFVDVVVPGDQLIIEVYNKKVLEKFIEVSGTIKKENRIVVKGKIIVTNKE